MISLRTLVRAKSVLVRALEVAVTIGMATLALDVLWGVFSRYVLGSQSPWTDPLATTLLVWLSMLGAALAYGDRAHLGFDSVVKQFHPLAQCYARLLVQTVVLVFAAVVMVGGGGVLVVERLASGQIVQGLGMLRGYVYLATPVSGAFIALFALKYIAEEWDSRPVAAEEHSE